MAQVQYQVNGNGNNGSSNNAVRNHQYECHLKKVEGLNDHFVVITIIMDGAPMRFIGAPKSDLATFVGCLGTWFPTRSWYGPRRYTITKLKEVLGKVYHNFALVNDQ